MRCRPGWTWTALLPRLTGRVFLGGLDGGACVDLSYCGLNRGRLNHRPLAELTDDDLAEACRRRSMAAESRYLLKRARLYADLEPLAQRYALLSPLVALDAAGSGS